MGLREEVLASGLDLARRDDVALAAALSVGRTKLVPTEIGNGMILETLGIAAGNALLDAMNASPDFRYVRPLLEQGWLRIDSPLVRATLDSLVSLGVISADNAQALKALAVVDDPVSVSELSDILNAEGY